MQTSGLYFIGRQIILKLLGHFGRQERSAGYEGTKDCFSYC